MIRRSLVREFRPIRFTPMRITPLIKSPRLTPFKENQNNFRTGPQMLPDSGGQPPCTPEDLKRYKRDWQGIVPVIALSHLKRHKEDVLHGGRSLNMLLEKQRETKDFDIYSPHPRPTATGLEKSIDKAVGCDICETEQCLIPKSVLLRRSAEGAPEMSDELYRVRTKSKKSFLKKSDPEMDVMKIPPNLRTVRHQGITHEALEEAYAKHQYLQNQPARSLKTRQDMRRIEEYLVQNGYPLPQGSIMGRTSFAMKPRRMIL